MYDLQKNVRKIFWRLTNHGSRKDAVKSLSIYLPEIIQTRLLGGLQKKSLEHNDCLYVTSVLERRVKKPNSQNFFQTNCLSVIPMLLWSIGTTLRQFVWK